MKDVNTIMWNILLKSSSISLVGSMFEYNGDLFCYVEAMETYTENARRLFYSPFPNTHTPERHMFHPPPFNKNVNF